jgi:hypothetical protein
MKMQTAILAVLFLISSMLLNIGLIVSLNFGQFFDKTADELNTSDAYIFIPEAMYTDEVEQYFRNHDEVSSFAKYSGIFTTVTYEWNGKVMDKYTIFCNIDEPRTLSQWKLVGDTLGDTPDAIYIPYSAKVRV